MEDIDIARLRKHYGMTQARLAEQLNMKQSFLSVVENGKSPMPAAKRARLREIFADADLEQFRRRKNEAVSHGHAIADHAATTADINLNDATVISQIFNHFHAQLHRENDGAQKALLEAIEALKTSNESLQQRNEALTAQNIRLTERNDRLTDRIDYLTALNDTLREQIDALRTENQALRARK